MYMRNLILVASAIALSACGEDFLPSDDGGVNFYAFSSGTYGVTNALAKGTDQCGLLSAYQAADKKIGVTVSGTQVTFNPANDSAAAANTLPKASLNGNKIDAPVEANYTVAFGNTCVVRIKRTMVGDVVADNAAKLSFNFKVNTETGTCDGNNTSFAAVPCESTYEFTATREP